MDLASSFAHGMEVVDEMYFQRICEVMVDSKQSKQFKAYLRMEFIGISHEEV